MTLKHLFILLFYVVGAVVVDHAAASLRRHKVVPIGQQVCARKLHGHTRVFSHGMDVDKQPAYRPNMFPGRTVTAAQTRYCGSRSAFAQVFIDNGWSTETAPCETTAHCDKGEVFAGALKMLMFGLFVLTFDCFP